LYEELLEKYERGVHVSFEGITNEQEQSSILKELKSKNSEIIVTTRSSSVPLNKAFQIDKEGTGLGVK